jgi:predicted HNH restriction endonuclease
VVSYPCLIPGCQKINGHPSDGLIAYHHYKGLKGGGMAIKPTDYHVIPLCAECHNLWHRMGESYFKLDREYILTKINEYLIDYIINLKNGGTKS